MRARSFVVLILAAFVMVAAPAFASDLRPPASAKENTTRAAAVASKRTAAFRKSKRASQPRTTLARCGALTRGQSLVSRNRKFRFAMQADGNAVLYKARTPLWSSHTDRHSVRGITLQCDQNLVVKAVTKQPLWASGTRGSRGTHLTVQDDGNVVLYTAHNHAVWDTRTAGGRPAPLPVPVVSPRVANAIGWFLSRIGSSAWEGRCELTAELAYGTSGRFPTARANWMSGATAQHAGVMGAPRGALVFYSTSSSGHVALSLGDGTVLSSSANGHIGRVAANYFQNPLGWKNVPF